MTTYLVYLGMIRLSELQLVKTGSTASVWISLDQDGHAFCFRGASDEAREPMEPPPSSAAPRHAETKAPGHDPGDLIIRIREKTCESQALTIMST